MVNAKTIRILLPLLLAGCRGAIPGAHARSAEAAAGCWALAPTIFSDRAGRPDRVRVARDTIELLLHSRRSRTHRQLKVHGINERWAHAQPDSAWYPLPGDSVFVMWQSPPNAYELRLQVRGDSVSGESFYYGDIWPPGRRAPNPIAGVRVGCPVPATS